MQANQWCDYQCYVSNSKQTVNIDFISISTGAKICTIISLFGITEYEKSAVIFFSGVLNEVHNTLCGDRAHPSVHLSVT